MLEAVLQCLPLWAKFVANLEAAAPLSGSSGSVKFKNLDVQIVVFPDTWFRLPLQCKWDLRSSGMLSQSRLVVTDVSGQPIGPIFRGKAAWPLKTCFSLQPGHYSSLTTPNLQHTANQERNDQCGNQHHSRELPMMGIRVPETCSAYKKYNKITSGIQLVFYSSVIALRSLKILPFVRRTEFSLKKTHKKFWYSVPPEDPLSNSRTQALSMPVSPTSLHCGADEDSCSGTWDEFLLT